MKEKTSDSKSILTKGLHGNGVLKREEGGFFGWFHKHDLLIYFVIVTALGIAMRILLFPCVRGDYTAFLQPWYKNIYENGASALGSQFGDYTPAYNYFLYLISLFGFVPGEVFEVGPIQIDPVLWGIKTVSCLFDFGIAIYVHLLVKRLTGSRLKGVMGYTLIVFGLTIFLNSALWGQCDAIYAFFIVGFIYYLLSGRKHLAFIFYGLSFCFKLQAIFVLPVVLVLWLKRQVKLRYLLYIPLVYVIVALPASLAAGGDFLVRFKEILLVYFNQTVHGYSQVTLNAGTFYALIFTNFKDETFISIFALFLAAIANGTLIFFFQRKKTNYDEKGIVKLFLVFMMTMPYFLPHMHERYFYLADVLVIVYVFLNPRRFYVAILAILNSMIGYMVYLWNVPFFNVVPQDGTIEDGTKALSFRFGAILYLVAIILVLKDFFVEIRDGDRTFDATRRENSESGM